MIMVVGRIVCGGLDPYIGDTQCLQTRQQLLPLNEMTLLLFCQSIDQNYSSVGDHVLLLHNDNDRI